MLLVREDEIERAVATLLEIEKTVVEGAGAAAYAAVAANPELFRGRKVGIVLSGGNIDMRLLSNVILREMSREGRILSLTVEIEDRPGLLASIATLVGDAGGNILKVSHNRMMSDITAKSADLGLVIEARDAGHASKSASSRSRGLHIAAAVEPGKILTRRARRFRGGRGGMIARFARHFFHPACSAHPPRSPR